MQVREYEEQLRQPSSYTRWFFFLHPLVLLHEQDLQNHVGDARTL
jgi:hypothetical protein